jgi:hypothetical protein
MEVHSDPAPPEGHALHGKSQALFPSVLPGQRDPTPGGHDPMPRQALLPVQRSHGQTRCARVSGDLGHLTIGDHPPSRNSRDHESQPGERGRS